MEMKECPSCGAEVPAVASRCKHCFHDFNEVPVKKSSNLIGLLILLVALGTIGAGTFSYLYYFNAAEKIVVDAETRSIVITRTSAKGTSSERVNFDEIQKVEYVMGGKSATFEVVAITGSGSRYIIQSSGDKPLKGHAEHIAHVIDKPLVEIRNISTFGD
jgi:ribosomal protein L40E